MSGEWISMKSELKFKLQDALTGDDGSTLASARGR